MVEFMRFILLFLAFFLAMSALPAAVKAAEYVLDKDVSFIRFSGQHAGDDFAGIFRDWSADIVFDPADLAASQVNVVIQATSAETGQKIYDGTLPGADWFDVKNHPEILFTSKSIEAIEGGQYLMHGDLTIRGITKPLQFVFTLSSLDENPVVGEAEFIINRFDYDLGLSSDPEAEWVSRDVNVRLKVVAHAINPAKPNPQ
jgi:cytochrome b561